MATFQADKGFHFSQNGSDPWALFVLVDGSDPAVYEFETDDREVIAKLAGADGVTRLDAPKRGRPPKVATTAPAGAGGQAAT